jgi:Domain of Unknown Function (DUF1080)
VKTKTILGVGLLAAGLLFAQAGFKSLFNGKSLDGWSPIGDANWKVADGVIEATTGTGFLVSKDSYKDFEMKAEFWVDEPANSGIFIRCTSVNEVTAANAYEVNIYDTRPDQKYATGAIVNVAGPATPVKAAGKWNTFEITARGSHMTIKLNGAVTADGNDSKNPQGPIALQHAAGVVRFRNLQIRGL